MPKFGTIRTKSIKLLEFHGNCRGDSITKGLKSIEDNKLPKVRRVIKEVTFSLVSTPTEKRYKEKIQEALSQKSKKKRVRLG